RRTLPRHHRARRRRDGGRRAFGISAWNDRGFESRRRRRSGRDGFCNRRHFDSAHLPRPIAHDFLFTGSALAAAHRPRRYRASRTARDHAWHRACRDPRADVAPEPDSRARERLYAHCAQQRVERAVRPCSPRPQERAHIRRDHHRTSDGRAAERYAHHRDNLLMARYRPLAHYRDRGSRLSRGRGVRTHVRDDLRRRQPGDRSRLRNHRPASENLVTARVGNPSLAIGLTAVAAIVLAAILGPILFRADPLSIDLVNILAGPSRAHPFGCDALGRDVLARVLWGARISLSISIVVVAISLVVGSLIGATAALSGGRIDNLIMRSVDIVLAFPGILLAIALAAILGPGL